MKRLSCLAVCVFLSFLWIPIASAAQNTGAATQKQKPPVQAQKAAQSGQVVRPKAGIAWKEKVLKQREIKKRAAAKRNMLMQQAPKTPPAAPAPAMP